MTLILENNCCFTKDLAFLIGEILKFFETYGKNRDVFYQSAVTRKKAVHVILLFYWIHASNLTYVYIVNGHYISILKQCFIKEHQATSYDPRNFEVKLRMLPIDIFWNGFKKTVSYMGK